MAAGNTAFAVGGIAILYREGKKGIFLTTEEFFGLCDKNLSLFLNFGILNSRAAIPN
jgi:hypothetical protein